MALLAVRMNKKGRSEISRWMVKMFGTLAKKFLCLFFLFSNRESSRFSLVENLKDERDRIPKHGKHGI